MSVDTTKICTPKTDSATRRFCGLPGLMFATKGGADLFAEEVEHASHTVGAADLRHQRRRCVGAAAWRRRGGGDDLRKAGAVHDGPGTVPVKRLPAPRDNDTANRMTARKARKRVGSHVLDAGADDFHPQSLAAVVVRILQCRLDGLGPALRRLRRDLAQLSVHNHI